MTAPPRGDTARNIFRPTTGGSLCAGASQTPPSQRAPQYHKGDNDYRIVFRSPNHWVAQKNTHQEAKREFDPWADLHTPKSGPEGRVIALRIMRERCPVRES